jgi:hypothetical protein
VSKDLRGSVTAAEDSNPEVINQYSGGGPHSAAMHQASSGNAAQAKWHNDRISDLKKDHEDLKNMYTGRI